MAASDPPPESEESRESSQPSEAGSNQYLIWVVCVIGLAIGAVVFAPKPAKRVRAPYLPPTERPQLPAVKEPVTPPDPQVDMRPVGAVPKYPNRWRLDATIRHWWGAVPDGAKAGTVSTDEHSNVMREDYAGAESCRKCHPGNYEDWSDHSHRWMNAIANDETVQGDFSGKQSMDYLGGTVKFVTEGGHRKMKLKRGDRFFNYRVTRTIGSRFFQYYAGLLEETNHDRLFSRKERQTIEHVLPFGYWMGNDEWVPTVHVFREADQDEREEDPFGQWGFVDYDLGCSECHTTWAFGDWMTKSTGSENFARYTPRRVETHLGALMNASRPQRMPAGEDYRTLPKLEMEKFVASEIRTPHPEDRPSLGVACENCHLGSAEHARRSTKDESEVLPSFFPVHPHIHSAAGSAEELTERSDLNVNFMCAKCHAGDRPRYANGSHTWNSTEFADAVQGFCYHPAKAASRDMNHLTCVTCHDPHKAIGMKWPNTAAQDDKSCIQCHEQFKTPEAQAAHSHHDAGTAGSHCMDCHMPKIYEGLQEMVRTHRIQNPVEKDLVEANQPNACNLCHLDKSVNWTLRHMNEWYGGPAVVGSDFRKNNPNPDAPAGLEWLETAHGPTRLAAGEALALNDPRPHLSALMDLLIEDSQLINRQFVQRGLKNSLGLDLKAMGYQFYMQHAERQEVINRLRADIIRKHGKSTVAQKKP